MPVSLYFSVLLLRITREARTEKGQRPRRKPAVSTHKTCNRQSLSGPAAGCSVAQSMQTMRVALRGSSRWSSASSWQCRQLYTFWQQLVTTWHLRPSRTHPENSSKPQISATGALCVLQQTPRTPTGCGITRLEETSLSQSCKTT